MYMAYIHIYTHIYIVKCGDVNLTGGCSTSLVWGVFFADEG